MREILGIFFHLTALISAFNSVKGLRVIEKVKENRFEGLCGKLKSKVSFQRESAKFSFAFYAFINS